MTYIEKRAGNVSELIEILQKLEDNGYGNYQVDIGQESAIDVAQEPEVSGESVLFRAVW